MLLSCLVLTVNAQDLIYRSGFDAGEAKIFAADLDEGSHDSGC